MENDKLLSIIIPIYNVAAYLPNCLDSVIHQTYHHLEIICIDDGATDESGKIADSYAAKDKRIKVIHQSNGGLGFSRNKGLKIATGEYVAFLDSDDFIALDFYANLMQACDNDDIVMTTSVVHYFSEQDKEKTEITGKIFDVSDDKERLILGSGICWNKIYRRTFLLDNDIQFYPKTNLIEDNYFTVKAYLLAKSIKSIDTSVYFYRIRATSDSHKKLTNCDFACLDIAKGIEAYKAINPDYEQVINKKISRELGTFYRRLSFPYKNEFKIKFKENFPNLKIAIRKPLKWVYAAYNEGDIIYHSFFGDRFVIQQRKK